MSLDDDHDIDMNLDDLDDGDMDIEEEDIDVDGNNGKEEAEEEGNGENVEEIEEESDDTSPSAADYDGPTNIQNADNLDEIEEEDFDVDDFDLSALDEEEDAEDEEDTSAEDNEMSKRGMARDADGKIVYDFPSVEQLEEMIADTVEENECIDVMLEERLAMNEFDSMASESFIMGGNYGTTVANDATTPFYPDEDEIDDGKTWSYKALILSAIKRNPEMPYVRPDWFEKCRLEMGIPEVNLWKESYKIQFSEEDVNNADTKLVEQFYKLRNRVLPEEYDPELDGPVQKEKRERYMARIKVGAEDSDDGTVAADESSEDMEERWNSWFEEVYEDDQLAETLVYLEKDDDNMQEDYYWNPRYAHLEERLENPGLAAKLIIAVRGDREDMVKSEWVTNRMNAEFPNLMVETQLFPEASVEDQLFEIWVEAYEDELLFSKRKHYYDSDWPGPDDFRQEDLEKLVQEVRFHLSDDA
eukprot:CAMPEP_0116015298 /NCGR_PEP_ID=MMETSP0321-20121206/6760_1 /TAXON_ID=163516 /ORGANISM="Leptocylindrus danicus var. danicus, Strain B650" /LENGTH=471 /DNA_ID=CAMNT_0003485055 /DNA_START=282 /DNA_END=1694 /DNA_ORIENTATION=+